MANIAKIRRKEGKTIRLTPNIRSIIIYKRAWERKNLHNGGDICEFRFFSKT